MEKKLLDPEGWSRWGPPAYAKVESALGTCSFSRAVDFEQDTLLSKFKCLGYNSIEHRGVSISILFPVDLIT